MPYRKTMRIFLSVKFATESKQHVRINMTKCYFEYDWMRCQVEASTIFHVRLHVWINNYFKFLGNFKRIDRFKKRWLLLLLLTCPYQPNWQMELWSLLLNIFPLLITTSVWLTILFMRRLLPLHKVRSTISLVLSCCSFVRLHLNTWLLFAMVFNLE